MNSISNAYWDAGKRDSNEDSLVLEELLLKRGKLIVSIVADGIGSLNNGAEASGYVIEELISFTLDEVVPLLNKGNGLHKVKRRILRKLYEISSDFKKVCSLRNKNMGTTLALLFIYERRFMAVNLGDSKIIKFKKKKMKELSLCHTNSDGSIYKCIGNRGFFEPYIREGFVTKNTGFLIASDGFYKKSQKEIYIFKPDEIKSEKQIEKRLGELARKVKNRGEKDNMSAVYIKCF